MIVTVASGKGGTGKTTVATSLALALVDEHPVFIDCDVEAANAHLFLSPEIRESREVGIPIPEVNPDLCTACGRCAEVCAFHAIVVVGKEVMVFPQLCHGCGSCTRQCPEGAIHEVSHLQGVMQHGRAGGIRFSQGILKVGEPMAVPLIHALKSWDVPDDEAWVIRDSPPGTACPVVETMVGSDVVLLATEPTPFGLHDLRLAAELAKILDLPAAVVINRDGVGDAGVEQFCEKEGIPVLMRIPLSREIGESLARGIPLVKAEPGYLPAFQELAGKLARMAGSGRMGEGAEA